MLKYRRNATRIGGGYATCSISRGTRLWLSIILSFLCAALLCCAFLMPKYSKAQIQADIDDTAKTLKINELTINGYNSSTADAKVFNKKNLTELYSALTGGAGNTLQAVKNTVTGPDVSYGTSTTTSSGAVTIPAYVSAKDLYDLNSNKNIVVDFGGQTWTVTFLTTDNNGDVIATLWLADAYKENGSYVRSAYGWATSETNGTPNATNFVSNMYASSLIRVKTLNGGDTAGTATKYAKGGGSSGTSTLNTTVSKADRIANPWAIYTLNNDALNDTSVNTSYPSKMNKSLVDYIDTPSQIKYTYFEDFNYHYNTLVSGTNINSYSTNEAISVDLFGYATGSTGAYTVWHSHGNGTHVGKWLSSTQYNTAYTNYTGVGYNDWAYDRVWLPSGVETGGITSGTYQGYPGIWQTSYGTTTETGQLKSMNGTDGAIAASSVTNTSSLVWLRSGNHGSLTYSSRYLASGGGVYSAYTGRTLGIRPALHLNLTKADAASINVVGAPSGTVATTYDGKETGQSIDTITANIPDWYDSTYYTDPTVLTVTYKNSKVTTPVSKVAEAGEYTATVTLKNTTTYMWSDGITNSSSERTFTFTVKKKELEIEFEEKNGVKVAKLKDETQIYQRDKEDPSKTPELITKYSKNGNISSAIYSSPDSTGDWYAHAFLTDADCNYSVSNTGVKFTVSKTVLNYPVLTDTDDAQIAYDGTEHTVYISGYDSTLMSCTPTDMSYDMQTKLLAIKVTDAKEYTVSFSLKNTELYGWDSDEPIKITVTPRNVQINDDQDNPEGWEKDTSPKELNFTVPTPLLTEADRNNGLNLVAVCAKSDGTVMAVAPTVAFESPDKYTVTIPSSYSRGEYTLTLKVADGENYAGSSQTVSFKITGQGIDVGYSDIVWKIGGKNYSVTDETEIVEIEYSGNPFTLDVDYSKSAYAADVAVVGGYGGDYATAVDLGDYTATVHLESTNAAFVFDKEFTLKIKIVPKELTLGNAEWQWQHVGDEDWNDLKDGSMPSFDGNKVDVRLSPDYLADLGLSESDYTVTYHELSDMTQKGKQTITVDIEITNTNYTTSGGRFIQLTKDWEITAKELKYEWVEKTLLLTTEKGTFECYGIVFDDGKDNKEYFDYYFTLDGDETTEYTQEEIEAYISENYTPTTVVLGKVHVRTKAGQDEAVIESGWRTFSTGAPKTPLAVSFSSEGSEYGKVDFSFTVLRGASDESSRVKVTVSGETLEEDRTFEGNSAELEEYIKGLKSGSYKIKIEVTDAGNYTLEGDSEVTLTIAKRKVELPTLKDVTFTGETIYFKDCIEGFDESIMKILGAEDNGIDYGREWRENGYYTKIELLDSSNYEFADESGTLGSEYEYNWKINKFTITEDMWNKAGKDGAALDLPEWVKNMLSDPEVLSLTYRYYSDAHSEALPEVAFESGISYYVNALLSGKEAVNFEFENGTEENGVQSSAKTVYAVPKASGASAFFGNVGKFVSDNYWVIIVILIVLLLFIVLMVVWARRKAHAGYDGYDDEYDYDDEDDEDDEDDYDDDDY